MTDLPTFLQKKSTVQLEINLDYLGLFLKQSSKSMGRYGWL